MIHAGARISAHVFLPANSVVEEHVFIGPGCVFTDDRLPRAYNKGYLAQPPVLKRGCSVGAGAVILPSVVIGENAMVGAGAVVSRDVPPNTVVRGEPAYVRDTGILSLMLLQQESVDGYDQAVG